MHVEGYVLPPFEPVYSAFLNNFATSGEVGAAVCVYYRGEPVVDLAGGSTGFDGKQGYGLSTLQPVFSISKGIVAIAANMLADRGMLDLDKPVACYWPEFGGGGKGGIPVRWLLTHQAGLAAIDEPISLRIFWRGSP
jgi:CubicO group peptidase (beta-lactamase class C family)